MVFLRHYDIAMVLSTHEILGVVGDVRQVAFYPADGFAVLRQLVQFVVDWTAVDEPQQSVDAVSVHVLVGTERNLEAVLGLSLIHI